MNLVPVILILVGIIHILPAKGVLGSAHLASLYGIAPPTSDLELLLRHRAILFALLGVFLIFAAFNKSQQPIAVAAGIISTASFIFLSWSIDKPNPLISRVVLVDWVATISLIIAGLLLIYKSLN